MLKITQDVENAEILNTFFLNPLKNLKIPESVDVNPFAQKMSHPVLKAILSLHVG